MIMRKEKGKGSKGSTISKKEKEEEGLLYRVESICRVASDGDDVVCNSQHVREETDKETVQENHPYPTLVQLNESAVWTEFDGLDGPTTIETISMLNQIVKSKSAATPIPPPQQQKHQPPLGLTMPALPTNNALDNHHHCLMLEEVKNSLQDLKKTVEEEGKAARVADKMRRIEFALMNTSLVTKDFQFLQATTAKGRENKQFKYTAIPVNADDVLKDILLSFRRGTGHLLFLYFIDLDNSGEMKFNQIKKEWVEAFRHKLSDKLDRLLGSYPRFQFRSDGRVVLYYS